MWPYKHSVGQQSEPEYSAIESFGTGAWVGASIVWVVVGIFSLPLLISHFSLPAFIPPVQKKRKTSKRRK